MARLIPRLLRLAVHRVAGPPTDREAGRALARKAAELARKKAAAGRPQLIAHLASFGPAGERRLQILNGDQRDV
jgi:hypothetical protein